MATWRPSRKGSRRAGAAARDSLGEALAVAHHFGGVQGARLAEAAQSAFVSGMHGAAVVAALIAAAGALVAVVALPARERAVGSAVLEPVAA